MTSTTDIRNRVIDQLMAINDVGYVRALSDMIKSSHVQEEVAIDQHTLNERELKGLKV